VLLTICRLTLAALFIYAAVGKIHDPRGFAQNVAAYRLLPIATVNMFAIVLPWVELLAGLALLHKPWVRDGAFLLALLNAVFITAAGSAMARGLDIQCGCFTLSSAHNKVGWGLIGRDALFLVLCLLVFVYSDRRVKRDASPA
jgi:uncharacterized membrane protein YphA (DoxX/SURF4 family)